MRTEIAGFNFVGAQRALMLSAASIAFATMLGFSALVRIPVPGTPVPVTLQTFFLLAGAGLLGRYYALQMIGWYLLLGLLGAPFFAGGGGLTHIMGASGGYLFGFILAAFIAGFFSDRGNGIPSKIVIYAVAALSIYIPGVIQLKLVTGSTWSQAVSMGALPFLLTDMAKAAMAVLGVEKIRNASKRLFSI